MDKFTKSVVSGIRGLRDLDTVPPIRKGAGDSFEDQETLDKGINISAATIY